MDGGWRTLGPVVLALASAGCVKVPIDDIQAGFALADATWFAEESTLFFFYDVTAQQGISTESVLEITYRTDDRVQDWVGIDTLDFVHPHEPVDCGFGRLCGSLSLQVDLPPRDVGLRLRYHREGEVFLTSDVVYNAIGRGPAHTNRSFVVYGVFTEDNRGLQWRGRHRFPTLRNEQVQNLGLRRPFRIEAPGYGASVLATDANPYGYATGCPADFVPTGLSPVETQARAVFHPDDLTLDASEAPIVCARAIVEEARAPFVTTAIAQKNPEVDIAFPVLRSPVQSATPITFYLAPCERTISADHDEMQRQRIQYGSGPAYCADDWQNASFVSELVRDFRAEIERVRPEGEDMVLVVGLHRDEPGIAEKLEEAMALVLPPERERSSPRVVGGFVFDSQIRDVAPPLDRLLLWCPANDPDVVDDGIDNPSRQSCGIVPDNASLSLGPFTLSALPILASRRRYLDFIDQFSKGQAGEVETLTFLAPEFTPTTDNVDLGGPVATFFNGEQITAQPSDAFSFCPLDFGAFFVFRSAGTRSLDCETTPDPECLPGGLLPIEALPQWHGFAQESSYALGLAWDFPFLLRMQYRAIGAVSAGAFGLSVPFGIGLTMTDDFGADVWTADVFPLGERLRHCKRFCDHPTFDSAGVYNVTQAFRDTYAERCYVPRYPMRGDSSFPLDP